MRKPASSHFRYGGKDWQYDANTLALTADPDAAVKGAESPDGAWRAVVRAGNLFLISTKDGTEKQLTTDGTTDAPYATPLIDPRS